MAGPGVPDGRADRESPVAESAGGRPIVPSRPPAVPLSALDGLVAVERHKGSAGFAPDSARLAEGWEYRFVAEGGRAEESGALYRELGFEVAIDPVGPATSAECESCRLVALLKFRALYTRRPPG